MDEPRLTEIHLFSRFGKTILFHVPTLRYWQISPLLADLVALLRDEPGRDPFARLAGRWSERGIRRALGRLAAAGILVRPEARVPLLPGPRKSGGVRHLEFMLTHGCNLRCDYCYGSGPDPACRFGSGRGALSADLALEALDGLCGPGWPTLRSVTFFGGEPLLELDLLREIVARIERSVAGGARRPELHLVTNGTLLTPAVVRYLDEHALSCQISVDGRPETHDRHRRFEGGRGSYDATLRGARHLLQARRRVPARMTACAGNRRLAADIRHLFDLGFRSVQVEPAIGDRETAAYAFDEDDRDRLIRCETRIARTMRAAAREGRVLEYQGILHAVRETRVIERRAFHHCGAGRVLLAVGQDGAVYPCHRFVGTPELVMGRIGGALDPRWRDRLLPVDRKAICQECWARYLCGGGCLKHAWDRHGNFDRPEERISCPIIRNRLECGLALNVLWAGVDDEMARRIWG